MKGSSDLNGGFHWQHRFAAPQRKRRCAASAIDERDDSHGSRSGAPRPGLISVVFLMPMTTSAPWMWSRRSLLAESGGNVAFYSGVAWTFRKHSLPEHSSAKAFLESIYQHYVGTSDDSATGVLLASLNSARAYFTFGTTSLINEDRASAAEHGEAPVLERDPFVRRSNWNISDLSIEVKETGVKAFGTVAFINSGKRAKVPSNCPGRIGASLSLFGNPGAYANSIAARRCATRRVIRVEDLSSNCIEPILANALVFEKAVRGHLAIIFRNSENPFQIN
jgi:hypothetical protein